MHGQWDWMRDPKIHLDHVGVGQRLHGRGLEARPQRDPPHLHEHRRQGTTTSATASCASTRTSAGALRTCPAAVELRQRLFLRVRHRGLRPRAGKQPAAAEGEAVGRVQSGLRAPHAAKIRRQATRTTSSTRRSRSRSAASSPPSPRTSPRTWCATWVALGDHVRPLPRRASRPSRRRRSREGDPWRVVPAPDARVGEHLRL